jgi:hypothetical protein
VRIAKALAVFRDYIVEKPKKTGSTYMGIPPAQKRLLMVN